ncbi:MAG TPA: hypothetical protein PK858_04110, partial [Saprospiraceae bacterium]|nr:hypothetical protein [Saprospiraceae bacterium]
MAAVCLGSTSVIAPAGRRPHVFKCLSHPGAVNWVCSVCPSQVKFAQANCSAAALSQARLAASVPRRPAAAARAGNARHGERPFHRRMRIEPAGHALRHLGTDGAVGEDAQAGHLV